MRNASSWNWKSLPWACPSNRPGELPEDSFRNRDRDRNIGSERRSGNAGESDRRQERKAVFVLETLEQFDGFGGGFPVRLVGSITLVLYGDEHSVGHSGGFASFSSVVKRFRLSRRTCRVCGPPCRGVVLGRPAGRSVLTIGTVDDVTGYPHVKNLTDTRAGESVLLKMFAPGDLLPSVVSSARSPREEERPGALTVCVFKEGSLLGQLIEVGGPGNRVTVAANCICLMVVVRRSGRTFLTGTGEAAKPKGQPGSRVRISLVPKEIQAFSYAAGRVGEWSCSTWQCLTRIFGRFA